MNTPNLTERCSNFSKFALIAAASAFFIPTLSAQQVWDSRSSLPGNNTVEFPARGAYIGGKFLLFSSYSTRAYWHSSAGTAGWTKGALPAPLSGGDFSMTGVAAGNGAVIVVGNANRLYRATSESVSGLPDTPVTWSLSSPVVRSGTHPGLSAIRHLNGQFIVGVEAMTGGVNPSERYIEFILSSDGETWTSKKVYGSVTGGVQITPHDIAFKPGATAGTGAWVVAGTNSAQQFQVMRFSEDMSSGAQIPLTNIGTSQRIAAGGGRFVMVTNNGKLFSSADGTAWDQPTLPATSTYYGDVHHNGEHFVVVGRSPIGISPLRPAILTSTDGVSWAMAGTIPFANDALSNVFNADGLWLATGGRFSVLTSGSASIGLPVITGPQSSEATVGGTVTLTSTVSGTPAATVAWLKNSVPVTDGTTSSGSVISGANTPTLTITGTTLADAGAYMLRATNSVGVTNSTAVTVTVSAASQGAILTPYGVTSSGGHLIPGASPAKAVIGTTGLVTFSRENGLEYLLNTFVGGSNYNTVGGINPQGTHVVLTHASGGAPPMIYHLASQSGTVLPAFSLPMGPVTQINYVFASGLAENGDVAGSIQSQSGQNHAFHYSASSGTYRLLGNVPNPGNDIASNIGGISSDGQSVSGYERTGPFDGPFVWTTSGGFTQLANPRGGLWNGDVRGISRNGRWIVGLGTAAEVFGSGQTAVRWDRDSGLTTRALQKRVTDTFGDALVVTNDGTAGGNVRPFGGFQNNRAAVWLPNGALVVLPDFLSEKYGLNLSGYTLNQVTSISEDRKTLLGTATNLTNQIEGWMLTLPEPIDLPQIPNLSVRNSGAIWTTSIGTVIFGTKEVGSPNVVQQAIHLRSDGTAPLTSIAVSFSGANAGDFSYSLDSDLGSLPTTLGVNEYVTLNVRFNPLDGAAGARLATLNITSNDPDANPLSVSLRGNAVVTSVSPARAAFNAYLALAGVPEGKRGDLQDADDDGLPNLLEFALGASPMDFTSAPASEISDGYLRLSYKQAQPDHVIYQVVTSDNLFGSNWVTTGVDQGVADENGVTTAKIPVGQNKGFLRLQVVLKP